MRSAGSTPESARRVHTHWRATVRRLACLCLLLASTAWSGEPSRRSRDFLEELQRRELHRLTASYCRDQLNDDPQPEQLPFVLALLKALAGQAMEQPQDDAATAWDEIETLANRYSQAWQPSLASLEVDLQWQWLRLFRARALLAAAQVDPSPKTRQAQASELLRTTADQLRDLNRRLDAWRHKRPAEASDEASRVQRLTQRLEFVAGQVDLSHADCYPSDSPDQVALLTQALQSFASLARLTPPSDLSWESRIREVECHRRLGNDAVARQRLEAIAMDDLPAPLRMQRAIEQARLEFGRGRGAEAIQLLRDHLPARPPLDNLSGWAEGMLTRIDLCMALARQSSQSTSGEDEPKRWQAEAVASLQELEEHASTYWVRRAEAMLATGGNRAADPTEIELKARAAANLFRRQQYAEAQSAYDQIARRSQELGLNQAAFEYGLKSAAILHQMREFSRAAVSFRQLAQRYPQAAQASQAHWLAVGSSVEAVREDPATTGLYEELLEEYIRRWPTGDQADEARYWYGQLLQQQGKTQEAIALWRDVQVTSTRFADALASLREAYHRRLSELSLPGPDRMEIATGAVQQFLAWRDALRSTVEEGSPLARDAVLSAAEFALMYDVEPAARCVDLVESTATFAQLTDQLPDRSHAWLGLVEALSGRPDNAREHWNEVDWNAYPLALALANRLSLPLAGDNDLPPQREALIELQGVLYRHLQATDRWRDDARLLAWHAAGLRAAGQRAAAIQLYRQLEERFQDRLDYQETLAELYETGSSTDEYEQALDRWRQVARSATPATTRWFRAKLGIAQNLARLGQWQRAAESIQVLQALHPELGGPDLRARFESLLQECRRLSP